MQARTLGLCNNPASHLSNYSEHMMDEYEKGTDGIVAGSYCERVRERGGGVRNGGGGKLENWS